MEKLYLNGLWNLKQVNGTVNCKAKVPCTNFTALIDAGVIKDPFIGTNEKEMAWVGESDWEFSRTFNVSQEVFDKKYVTLECKMLDTIASIIINGKLLANTENCHLEYSFNIKDFIKVGENQIKISFESPVEYVKKLQKQEMVPMNNNGQNGIPHIRKPQCHFGWDWGPVLVPSGIPKDIYIGYMDVPDFDTFDIAQDHKNDVVDLTIKANLKEKGEYNYLVKVISPNGTTIATNEVKGEKVELKVSIVNPEIWWTYELNQVEKQPLYEVVIDVLDGDTVVNSISKKVGLRTIKLNTDKDEYGSNFCFELNGVKIFIKGANFIPLDSFIDRVTKEKYDYYFDAARFSNFNMLRVWGGGFYGDDYFYNKCDEMGILVWQDFMFACQPYPFFDNSLLNNVLREVKENVNRIKHHASLALWCGNNEIEAMDIQWQHRPKYLKWTEKFFYHILPSEISKYDEVTSFIPGSPYGVGYKKGVAADNVGDTHLWAVWHGLQPLDYYAKRMTRFCSEYGFESLPDLKAIEKFAETKDYSLNSEVFNSHQKCLSGNKKMKYYIAERFSLPKHFIDYIYLSQICQLECCKAATEHWRRSKGRCNGSMYWQFNDCWPVCSWSSLDYYGNYKALQYGAHHFNDPFTISIKKKPDRARVYIHNDTLEKKNVHLNMRFMTFGGEVKFEKDRDVEIEPNSVIRKRILMMEDLKGLGIDQDECFIIVKMYEGDKLIARRTGLFKYEKNLKLPKAQIDMTIEKKDGYAYIHLISDTYARYVSVYSKTNSNPFSDNFFDLVPNEEIVIKQKLNEDQDLEKLRYDYTVKSLCDIEPNGTRAQDNFERFKVLMEPINFFQYIFNLITPGDYKIK